MASEEELYWKLKGYKLVDSDYFYHGGYLSEHVTHPNTFETVILIRESICIRGNGDEFITVPAGSNISLTFLEDIYPPN